MKVTTNFLAMSSSTLDFTDMEYEHDGADSESIGIGTIVPTDRNSIKIQTTLSKSTQRLVQNFSMIFITLQQSINPLLVRYAHRQSEQLGTSFIASAVVLTTELVRITLCCTLLCMQHGSIILLFRDLRSAFIQNKSETAKVSVPAFIYVIQNNLYFFALKRVDATLFSISYQLRILTVALLTKILLGRIFSNIQWGALLISLVGVVCVQSSSNTQTSSSPMSSLSGSNTSNKLQTFSTAAYTVIPSVEHLSYDEKFVGLLAVLVMCGTSAFAGVYLEGVLKKSSCDILMQNIRLSVITSPFAVLTLLNDYVIIQGRGFCYGWTSIVWLIIFSNAVSGIVVAAVMKYADNIRKGYCQSVALGGTALLSILVGDARFTLGLASGVSMVVVSIFLYTFYPPEPSTHMLLVSTAEHQKNASNSHIFELNSDSDSSNDDDGQLFEKATYG